MKNSIFTRISASENSFLFIDATQNEPDLISKNFGFDSIPEFVKSWTMSDKGISADGLVFVTKSIVTDIDYKWDFYNCDGSVAEMCGNASRAMYLYALKYLSFGKSILRFGTLAGNISTEMLDGNTFKVEMPKWKIVKNHFILDLELGQVGAIILDTGVPHLVIEVDDIFNRDFLYRLARFFRFYEATGAKGANVTFYQSKSKTRIMALTFERGVEDFTKSCGTGAVAAAIAFLLRQVDRSSHLVEVKVPGGELEVIVNFEKFGAELVGKAQIDFEIHF